MLDPEAEEDEVRGASATTAQPCMLRAVCCCAFQAMCCMQPPVSMLALPCLLSNSMPQLPYPCAGPLACTHAATTFALSCRSALSSCAVIPPAHPQAPKLGGSKVIDREDDYKRRRLNQRLSPDRADAFQLGEQTPAGHLQVRAACVFVWCAGMLGAAEVNASQQRASLFVEDSF